MDYPQTEWRLLHSLPAPGAWNMAVDEAILEAAGRGEVLPTLRLYAWDPPCLSLGYAQSASEIDRQRLLSLGWQLVRRPTGGRAILHADELTYAVAGPHAEPRLSGSVLESYRRLSAALLFALNRLGLPARSVQEPLETSTQNPSPPTKTSPDGPVCFEMPSIYEITANGKKLIGSAQARRKEGVLQHGSLPLYGDLTRITKALVYQDEKDRSRAAARLLERAVTVESVLGCNVTWQAAAGAFTQAFQQVLNVKFCRGELTPSERQRAEALAVEKYGHPGWTRRV